MEDLKPLLTGECEGDSRARDLVRVFYLLRAVLLKSNILGRTQVTAVSIGRLRGHCPPFHALLSPFQMSPDSRQIGFGSRRDTQLSSVKPDINESHKDVKPQHFP